MQDPKNKPVGAIDAETAGTGVNGAAALKPRIAYNDLREWIREAEKLGEVKVVKGATWQEDIGQATEMVQHSEDGPCVIFDEIPGFPQGFRVLVNFFGGKRKNMTLGFPPGLSRMELGDAFVETYLKDLKTLPFKEVETGPIFENVMLGDDVDVMRFPVPHWHERDGGRYFGTGSYNVTRDPDEGWINVGTYRVMIQNKNTVGFYISPGKHGRMHRDKFAARGEMMPAVFVPGGDPLTFLMAQSEVPYGTCEYDLVGAMRGAPMSVVRGKVTGLPIPANAEIAVEGFVDPTEKMSEGPFGEWTGYYGSDTRPEPIMHVKAIYHRNDPIIVGCPPQRPPDELARYRAVTRSPLLKQSVQRAGVPDVKDVWAHEVGTARMLVGISIKQRYPGHARQAGHVAAMCHVGAYAGKYVIVVDDDIDVSDLDELIWAMLTRSDPATSIDIIRNAWSTPLDPRITPEQKAAGDFTNSRAIIDACRPFHWRHQFPAVSMPSAEVRKRTREKFGYLLD